MTCVRYRLRPVTVEDAAFIVKLRTRPGVSRFVHETSSRVEDQAAWLEAYFARPGDYYFIVEDANSGEPQGTVGLYNVTEDASNGEAGRWVLKKGSMAAVECAWMIYEIAFAKLGLESVRCQTWIDNTRVVSFLDSFGVPRLGVLQASASKEEQARSAIGYCLKADEWPAIRARRMRGPRRDRRDSFDSTGLAEDGN